MNVERNINETNFNDRTDIFGMKTLFDEHFKVLTKDLDQILTDNGYDQLLVYSGGLKMQFANDLPYPFMVNTYFKMFLPGETNPNCWVIWRVEQKPILLFYQPEDFWHFVPELDLDFWSNYYEIHRVKKPDEAERNFGNTTACAFLGEIDDLVSGWSLGERNPDSIIAAINWQRSYKSLFEQACIQKANEISAKGHFAAKEAFYAGASELEISLEFQRACQLDEFRLAHQPVVGINEHTGILHYIERDTNRLSKAKLHSLLIDAGASYLGYASDITRTYSYKDHEFGELIRALDSRQQQLVREIQLGQSFQDINTRSKLLCASILKEFDIVYSTPESTLETGLIESFYPHGVGHFLGLQPHDVAGLRSFESNFVFTIEPGIYFIPMLLNKLAQSELKNEVNWDKVKNMLPFGGVRIEDDVLMTETGPVNLTRQAFNSVNKKN
ncbi:MAG: Xaa-Pro dipeptidase [Bacteroidota bacterium]